MSLLIFQLVRGAWFIEPVAANAYKPMVVAALKGDQQVLAALMKEKKVKEKPGIFSAANVPTYQFGSTRKDLADMPDGTVAVTPVTDVVMKQDTFCSYGTQSLAAFMQKADNSPNVSGHLLYIDSPGGSVDGTLAFSEAIKSLNKPVVAFTDGMMASAAYWIGSSAKEVYANNALACIGSIGTYISWTDWSEYLQANGIKEIEQYATASTEKNKAFREAGAGNMEPLIAQLDIYNEAFMNSVARNRYGRGLDKTNTLKGQIHFAPAAKQYGLIDGIASMNDALNRVQKLAKKS